MPATADQLFANALALPPEERADLTDRLIASLAENLPPDIERAQLDKVRRRMAQIEAGEAELIPGEQVLAEVRALLGARAAKKTQAPWRQRLDLPI